MPKSLRFITKPRVQSGILAEEKYELEKYFLGAEVCPCKLK